MSQLIACPYKCRVWAYLRYREGILIGKNRVYRLLKENNLLATNARKLRACRTPVRSKPRTKRPNELWGIDMTKIAIESWGWLYLHVVKDWGSKKITELIGNCFFVVGGVVVVGPCMRGCFRGL